MAALRRCFSTGPHWGPLAMLRGDRQLFARTAIELRCADAIANRQWGGDDAMGIKTTLPSDSTPEPDALPLPPAGHIALTGNASIPSMARGGLAHTSAIQRSPTEP